MTAIGSRRSLPTSWRLAIVLNILTQAVWLNPLGAATATYSVDKNGKATLLDFDPYEGDSEHPARSVQDLPKQPARSVQDPHSIRDLQSGNLSSGRGSDR